MRFLAVNAKLIPDLEKAGKSTPPRRLVFVVDEKGVGLSDALLAVRYSAGGRVYARAARFTFAQAGSARGYQDPLEITLDRSNLTGAAAAFRDLPATLLGWAARPDLGHQEGKRPDADRRNWDVDFALEARAWRAGIEQVAHGELPAGMDREQAERLRTFAGSVLRWSPGAGAGNFGPCAYCSEDIDSEGGEAPEPRAAYMIAHLGDGKTRHFHLACARVIVDLLEADNPFELA